MRDSKDDLTVELPIGKTPQKRGRKPKNPVLGAMDAAKRKQEQRTRQAEAIYQRDSHEWTDAECMAILAKKSYGKSAVGQQAWEQLGKLRGWIV